MAGMFSSDDFTSEEAPLPPPNPGNVNQDQPMTVMQWLGTIQDPKQYDPDFPLRLLPLWTNVTAPGLLKYVDLLYFLIAEWCGASGAYGGILHTCLMYCRPCPFDPSILVKHEFPERYNFPRVLNMYSIASLFVAACPDSILDAGSDACTVNASTRSTAWAFKQGKYNENVIGGACTNCIASGHPHRCHRFNPDKFNREDSKMRHSKYGDPDFVFNKRAVAIYTHKLLETLLKMQLSLE